MTDESLFAHALAILDPVARVAFLNRECTDPAQRARIERLLAAHKDDSFLEPPSPTTSPTGVFYPEHTASLNPERPTHTFDPNRITGLETRAEAAAPVTVPGYEVLSVLGAGGMGVVYRAVQTAVGRVVALKMIRGGLVSASERARFRAEAEAAAKLTHPGIARVYEFGESDGVPYFTLEYCDSGSLAGKLDGTPWHPRAAARLTEMLADAVDAAHRQGIVHRDLKPANVLLARQDGPDGGTVTDPRAADLQYAALRIPHGALPKVTDFGISKRLDSPDGPTATGAVMGTPSYMSPEQARGDSKDVGPSADVYALGAILYELLTGRPPFKAAGVMETLDQVRNREPVAVRALNPVCPRDLETICLKCLQKEPAKRYPNAGQLADDLRRFQEGRPIAARPVGPVERAWRWCRRNPTVASLSVAVVVVLVGGITATTWGLVRALDAEANARAALTRVTEEEEQVRGERDDKEKARAAEEEVRKGLQIELLSRQIDDVTAQAERIGDDSLLGHYLRLLPTLPPHASALRDYLQLKILVVGKMQYEARARDRSIRGSVFSATTGEMIRVHHDGALSVGDPLSAHARVTMRVPGVRLDYVTHSDNNRVLVAKNELRAEDGFRGATAFHFFDMATGRLCAEVPRASGRMEAQIGRDGRRYLSYRSGRVPKDDVTELWDTASGKLLGAWSGNRLANHSPDSKFVIAFGKVDERPQPVRIYAAEDGRLVHTIPQGAAGYLYAAITPSGKYLVTFTCKEVQWWRTSDWKPEGKPSLTRNSDRQIPLRYGTTGMARLENSNTRSRYVFDEYALMVGREQGGERDEPIGDIIGGSTEVMLRGQEDPREFPGAPVYCDEASLVLEKGDYLEFAPLRIASPPLGHRYAPVIRTRTVDGRFLPLQEDGFATSIDFAAEKKMDVLVTPHKIRGRDYLIVSRGPGFGAGEDQYLIPVLPGGYDHELLALWVGVISFGEMDARNVFHPWDEATWNGKRAELIRRLAGRPEAEALGGATTNALAWVYNRIPRATTAAELMTLYDRLIREDPHSNSYFARAHLHHQLGDVNAAVRDTRTALQLQREPPVLAPIGGGYRDHFQDAPPPPKRWLVEEIVLNPGLPADYYQFALDFYEQPPFATIRLLFADLARYRLRRYQEVADQLLAVETAPVRNALRIIGVGHPITSVVITQAVFHQRLRPETRMTPSEKVLLAMCQHQLGQKEVAAARFGAVFRDAALLPELKAEAHALMGVPPPPPKKPAP